MTFRVDCGISGREFIKVGNANTADFTDEARRLRWAAPYVAVSQMLDFGLDEGLDEAPDGDLAWLHTGGLPGLSAVRPQWLASPDVAVRAIASGLRTLHDRLPVRSCPFDWSVAIAGTSGESGRATAGRFSWRSVMATHARLTHSSMLTAAVADMSTSAVWLWPTGGPTSRWRRWH